MDIRKKLQESSDLEDLKQSLLDLDSEFRFKCRRCGKCCKNQDTIILNPRDIFRIARKQARTMSAVIGDYTEVYIGSDSRIPIVHLLPKGPKNTCPLLVDGRCSVHDCKPGACALYPLARVIIAPAPGERIGPEHVRYMLNDYICGSAKRVNTVRSWLDRFNIPEHDEFFIEWSELTIVLGTTIRELEETNRSPKLLEALWNITYDLLYIQYDMMQDFMPQFEAAAQKVRKICSEIRKL